MARRTLGEIARKLKEAGDLIVWTQSLGTALIEFVGVVAITTYYLKTHPEVIVLVAIALRQEVFPLLGHILGILAPLHWLFPLFGK
jgi:hypothetical protein